MSTTIQDLEAVLPPSAEAQHLEDLRVRVDGRLETALIKFRAYCRAWRALDGQRAGPELDNRIAAATNAGMALRAAGYEWMDAEAALAMAESEEG